MAEGRPVAAWDAKGLAAPHMQPDKARRVRSMFDAIAPTYEMVNRLASAGRDAAWRRAMVCAAAVRSEDTLLDVACGTGDVCRAFSRATPAPRRIVGVDFAGEMLRFALPRSDGVMRWCQADAAALPFADASFSLVTCAFGIRNFQNLEEGLREMWRVLQPGGRAVLLEFGMPSAPGLRSLYRFYFTRVMPLAASIVSRDRSGAYRYLPQSVLSFPGRAGIVASLRRVGFAGVDVFPLTLGIVSVYRARK